MPDAKLILDNGDSVFAGMVFANVERDGFGAKAVFCNLRVFYFVEECDSEPSLTLNILISEKLPNRKASSKPILNIISFEAQLFTSEMRKRFKYTQILSKFISYWIISEN